MVQRCLQFRYKVNTKIGNKLMQNKSPLDDIKIVNARTVQGQGEYAK